MVCSVCDALVEGRRVAFAPAAFVWHTRAASAFGTRLQEFQWKSKSATLDVRCGIEKMSSRTSSEPLDSF